MNRSAHLLLIGVALATCLAVFLLPPIAQDPAYHDFSDKRRLFGLPNFWNVVSNLPFLVLGALGLAWAGHLPKIVPRSAFRIFCLGVLFIGFGSSYYHWAPSNETLVWDRLPMTIAFMALSSLLISERVSADWGRRLLWPFLILGLLSVLWWHVSELRGAGDLRPYALVQFLPMLLLPLVLWLFEPKYIKGEYVLAAFGLYLAAKLAEHFDSAIYDAIGFSGHSVKHLLAAAGIFALLMAFNPKQNEGNS